MRPSDSRLGKPGPGINPSTGAGAAVALAPTARRAIKAEMIENFAMVEESGCWLGFVELRDLRCLFSHVWRRWAPLMFVGTCQSPLLRVDRRTVRGEASAPPLRRPASGVGHGILVEGSCLTSCGAKDEGFWIASYISADMVPLIGDFQREILGRLYTVRRIYSCTAP